MKRRDQLKHLESNGCEFLRECGNHSIYVHREKKKVSSIPRHNEINEMLESISKMVGHCEESRFWGRRSNLSLEPISKMVHDVMPSAVEACFM